MHYLLFYDTAPDYLERRGEYRDAHLALAWQAVERGELLLGGATSNPPDGALLLFEADSPDIPAAFAQSDPYVLNGVVTGWHVKAWNTVVGAQASAPVKPAGG